MEERTWNPETDSYTLPEADAEGYDVDSVELEEVTP